LEPRRFCSTPPSELPAAIAAITQFKRCRLQRPVSSTSGTSLTMCHRVEGPLWVANLSTAAHLRECPESALSCRCSRHRQAASVARGRVKRRSPTIIEQFTVAARAMAWRIFRIPYPKSNRIACFHKGGDFSHGLHPIEPIPAGISKGRCGGMNTSSRREAERPFWVSKAALCCPTVRLSSLLGQALRQNDSFAN